MFTEMEKQEITSLLMKAVAPADTLTVDGVHGLLFGLAISPAVLMPGDWLTLIFGREMALFSDRKQAETHLGTLFAVYTRMQQANRDNTLAFPFDIGKLSRDDQPRIRDWCLGLTRVLSVHPEQWGITEHDRDPADMSDEEHELSASIGVVTSMAYPEDAHAIFTPLAKDVEESPEGREIQAKALFFLPMAVDYIRHHGNRLREEALRRSKTATPKSEEKPGRNDPCPCNSGKKYKKCCGA